MNPEDHRRLILDQFTRQAAPFREFPAHSTEDSVDLVLKTTEVGPSDTVLDVACGPGLMACALAGVARNVTGIDITPAMIEQAEDLRRSKGLANLSWDVGDVATLPYPDASFSLVFTRYSYHHILDTKPVFAEMVRVCKPGGRVALVDVYSTSPAQAEAYDRVETLRDPSHVRALGLSELEALFQAAGLEDVRSERYGLDVGLEPLLAASFSDPADLDTIRRTFADDIGRDLLGVGAYRAEDGLRFAFPTVILVGRKPG